MKKMIFRFIVGLHFMLLSTLSYSQVATYDISFTGGQWEDEEGQLVDPNEITNCGSIIYHSFLVQVGGGGLGSPSSTSYPLASGGAVITLVISGGATLVGDVYGSFAGYFDWAQSGNTITGTQNVAIPLNEDPFDNLNGINAGKIVVALAKPNQQGATYGFTATVAHPNPSIYNTSTEADIESNFGTNSQSCVLPIKLNAFTANRLGSQVVLDWSSESEINASYFAIERATPELGVNRSAVEEVGDFQVIGKVNALGSKSTYSFVDQLPNLGLNYYRLKMVDIDGSFSYSRLNAVEFLDKRKLIDIFPNPFVERVRISSDDIIDKVNIYSIDGSLQYSASGNGKLNTLELENMNLNGGVYQVEILKQNGGKEVSKMIKISK